MKFYNYKDLLILANKDTISKYNKKNLKEIIILEKLDFIVQLKSSESNFLKLFFDLTKLIFFIFDKKICIFNIFKEKYRKNKRNSLIFNIGITIRNFEIYLYLNYIKNILSNISKKIDNNFLSNLYNCGYYYYFSNLNYFIGLKNNEIFYKLNFNYRINLLLKKKKKINILKLNEKLFL